MVQKSTTPILVVVNGEERTLRAGDTIADLLHALGLDPEQVAIEVDRHIVKRAEWASTVLPAGTQLEIVRFVGGG